ncbi:hypothetical protein OG765_28435 [Streptomyces sp. NBC_00555]|uniref:hypothetical protein n=1 Tax=Streptomyces sp. NBC_00555 TaxID=2903662 RepID=UPI002252E0CD|nr:hypothetical protein [Streptomyces sp. NBC_00555]MCX5009409.1 hypothetical protein [Streptomyces sp. NBC_00555]MCX5014888.1 hypothetical protein [Streptomyces sp. NBC_00555]
MSKSPQVGPLTPLTKKKLFDGLAPWQVVLSLLPLGLLFIGGAIGGGLGALGMVANVKIAKTQLPTAGKVAAMLGVGLAAVLVFLAVAGLLSNAVNG